MPIFSIVIPSRHRNDRLIACLRRLAPGKQTMSVDQYETVVTDDGSDGTTEAVVREQFPWARWTAGPRRGPAANRNHGARQARGEWIVFTDDDCLPASGWLAAFAAAVAGGNDVYEGRTTCEAGLHTVLDEAPINLTGGVLWSCNMMIRRSRFEGLGGFDERFPTAAMEDVEFLDRVAAAGQRPVFVPDAVVDHPPRKRRCFAAAAALWESRVLFDAIKGRPSTGYLPLHVLKVRVSQLLQWPVSTDSVQAALSAVVETTIVAAKHRGWRRRHLPRR